MEILVDVIIFIVIMPKTSAKFQQTRKGFQRRTQKGAVDDEDEAARPEAQVIIAMTKLIEDHGGRMKLNNLRKLFPKTEQNILQTILSMDSTLTPFVIRKRHNHNYLVLKGMRVTAEKPAPSQKVGVAAALAKLRGEAMKSFLRDSIHRRLGAAGSASGQVASRFSEQDLSMLGFGGADSASIVSDPAQVGEEGSFTGLSRNASRGLLSPAPEFLRESTGRSPTAESSHTRTDNLSRTISGHDFSSLQTLLLSPGSPSASFLASPTLGPNDILPPAHLSYLSGTLSGKFDLGTLSGKLERTKLNDGPRLERPKKVVSELQKHILALHDKISPRDMFSKWVSASRKVAKWFEPVTRDDDGTTCGEVVVAGSVGKRTCILGAIDCTILILTDPKVKSVDKAIGEAVNIADELDVITLRYEHYFEIKVPLGKVSVRFGPKYATPKELVNAVITAGIDKIWMFWATFEAYRVQFLSAQKPAARVVIRLLRHWVKHQKWSAPDKLPAAEILDHHNILTTDDKINVNLQNANANLNSKEKRRRNRKMAKEDRPKKVDKLTAEKALLPKIPPEEYVESLAVEAFQTARKRDYPSALAYCLMQFSQADKLSIRWPDEYRNRDVWYPLEGQVPLVMDPCCPFINLAWRFNPVDLIAHATPGQNAAEPLWWAKQAPGYRASAIFATTRKRLSRCDSNTASMSSRRGSRSPSRQGSITMSPRRIASRIRSRSTGISPERSDPRSPRSILSTMRSMGSKGSMRSPQITAASPPQELSPRSKSQPLDLESLVHVSTPQPSATSQPSLQMTPESSDRVVPASGSKERPERKNQNVDSKRGMTLESTPPSAQEDKQSIDGSSQMKSTPERTIEGERIGDNMIPDVPRIEKQKKPRRRKKKKRGQKHLIQPNSPSSSVISSGVLSNLLAGVDGHSPPSSPFTKPLSPFSDEGIGAYLNSSPRSEHSRGDDLLVEDSHVLDPIAEEVPGEAPGGDESVQVEKDGSLSDFVLRIDHASDDGGGVGAEKF